MLPVIRQNRHRRRGAAAVEFALAAPILFLFILAIFEFGRAFMVIDFLGDAARVGCREGAIQGKATASISSDVTNQLQGLGISGATVTVEVNGAVADSSTANSGDTITVSVSVPVGTVTWTGTNFLSGNLTGQSSLAKQ